MEARSLSLPGRSVRYLAGTTSWHPTFEVLFLAGGRHSLTSCESIAHRLISYGNVYVVERAQLLGTRALVDGSEALLGWTKVSKVRRPVLAAAPSELPLVLDFTYGFPQFALGVVALPRPAVPDQPGLIAGVGNLLRSLLSLPSAVLSSAPHPPSDDDQKRLASVPVPHIDLTRVTDDDSLAREIRSFASSIKPTSPAHERRPRRPWATPT